MTDTPDIYGRKSGPPPFQPRVVTASAPAASERERTDHEQIAEWVHFLSYRGMIEFAQGVLGPDATKEQVLDLADKLDSWSNKTRRPQ